MPLISGPYVSVHVPDATEAVHNLASGTAAGFCLEAGAIIADAYISSASIIDRISPQKGPLSKTLGHRVECTEAYPTKLRHRAFGNINICYLLPRQGSANLRAEAALFLSQSPIMMISFTPPALYIRFSCLNLPDT